jgi:hypothetical protein
MTSGGESCKRFTKPYKIKLTAHRELVGLDASAAPEAAKEPATEDVLEYSKELPHANSLATQPAWLISHVPLWDVAKGAAAEKGPWDSPAGAERAEAPWG